MLHVRGDLKTDVLHVGGDLKIVMCYMLGMISYSGVLHVRVDLIQ